MKKIRILNLNHLGWKTWSARLIETIMWSLPPDRFSYQNLVGYGFLPQAQTTSVYATHSNWFYRNFRYKTAIWFNFLFDWMTPGCVDMDYLHNFEPYTNADIIHLHCVQWWYFNWKSLPEICKEKKVIMTLHDDWIISGNDSGNLFHPYKTKRQYDKRRQIFEKCDITYVWVSNWITDKARRDGILWSNGIKTIYNGIDMSIFAPQNKNTCREELWLPADKKIILSMAGSGGKTNVKWLQYVNRIIEEHQHDPRYLFVTIWNSKAADVSGQLKEVWYISRELTAKYFSAADMFLYPTLMDSFGLMIAESLSCWCPVVTFDTGWAAEIVKHGENGYVAKRKDHDDLLAWFNWCLNISPSRSVRLDEKFSHEAMVQSYSQEYLTMMGTKPD